MNLNSLDARAVTQPGGLYAGVNDALLQTVAAYLQHKEREANAQRQMRRDEVGMGREQLRDALMQAERYGVAPAAQDSGWLRSDAQPLIEAARAKHAQAQKDDGVVRLAKRLQAIQGGVNPGDMTPDEARVFQQSAQRRALEDSRAALGYKADQVRLGAMEDEKTWNSPTMRSVRGVGDWLGKVGLEAVKTQGRQREQKVPGLDNARLTLRDLDIAASTGQPFYGPNNQVVPADKIPAYRQALAAWIAEHDRGASGPAVPSVGGAVAPPTGGPAPVNTQAIDDIVRTARAKLPVSAQIQ